jgi:hypothetical protein
MMSFQTHSIAVVLALVSLDTALADPPTLAERKEVIRTISDLLGKTEQMELFSIDPTPPEFQQEKPKEAFHEYKVIGKVTPKNEETKEISQKLNASWSAEIGLRALCFEPRHGLVLTVGKKKLELLICFHCSTTFAFLDGEGLGAVTTDSKGQELLDKLLTKNNVPLARKPSK